MKQRHLRATPPRRFVATTDSHHPWPLADNVLDRKYRVKDIADVNRVWAGDITYVPTAQGWLYLAVVLDLKSRRVAGWSLSHSLEQTLLHDAFEMAVAGTTPEEIKG